MILEDITLIVPTKNEAGNIGRFLHSVPAGVPILVVDASTAHTCEVIQRCDRPEIVILRDGGNIAAARQLAAEHARTEWLLFSDADVIFSDDYFSILEDIEPRACHAGIVGAKLSRDRHRHYYFLFSLCLRFFCAAGVPAGSGSNMLVRRSALLQVGGFDLRLSCNEDSELIWRLHRHGYTIDYAGNLKVYECDHRRLDRGAFQKTVHSLTRCALLFAGLMNGRMKNQDWGYWCETSSEHLIKP